MPSTLSLVLTPHGSLRLDRVEDEMPLDDRLAERLEKNFDRGSGHGLLHLGAAEAGTSLPSALAWWRDFAMRFIAELCSLGETASRRALPAPSASELAALVDEAPPMRGCEYLRPKSLVEFWREIGQALETELAESGLSLRDFLKSRNRRWRLVGRVHFNLAENRRDPESPFAFMATYTSSLSSNGELRHQPLGQALREFAGAGDKAKLLQLLKPVQEAAETCPWLKIIVDSGEIFHPLRWEPEDAVRFLRDVETMETAGLVIRMPANWRMNRPSRPSVEATVGATQPSVLGVDGLLDFRVEVSLDGETLTDAEIDSLLATTHGLALLRGKWVEVDQQRLRETLDKFQRIERLSEQEGIPFGEAMRLLAGAEFGPAAKSGATAEWGHVQAGAWLAEALANCRSPEGMARTDPGEGFKATLRPYQQVGVQWLHFLTRLGLGACLADDMGLGKTIQVLAMLSGLARQAQTDEQKAPSLLVAPASLLANWAQEAER